MGVVFNALDMSIFPPPPLPRCIRTLTNSISLVLLLCLPTIDEMSHLAMIWDMFILYIPTQLQPYL